MLQETEQTRVGKSLGGKMIALMQNQKVRGIMEVGMRANYKLITDVTLQDLPRVILADPEIHGVLFDLESITPEAVAMLRQTVKEDTFPIILMSRNVPDQEVGRWIGCGVTEILQLPMAMPLIGRRIGSLIRLYCVSRNLENQAVDRLTGLYNRYAFYHHAKLMMQEAPEADYTIVISDIVNFKLINERFGEIKGDELLHYIGGCLSQMNSEFSLFARYAGDQFVGIIRNPEDPSQRSDDMMRAALEGMYQGAPVDHYRVKLGIYDKVDKELPISILCDRARMALNSIKYQYDRMFARYNLRMQQQYEREQRILESMEEALEQEQFQVYYQPKHDTVTSEIVGAEALVRWIHPAYGFMSPGDFIPLFEKHGFIYKVDRFVLRQVCKDLRSWIDRGLKVVPVSVNASRMDFMMEDFMRASKESFDAYDIDTSLVHLEVTESVYMEDVQLLQPIFEKLKDVGIRIELDDFGSGFSSLGILTKLPLDVIKLDINMVGNLETQPKIVESIVQLMHTLGYKVIAEGVDNDYQMDLLQRMGCDYVQGYYYSRPLTLSGFENYMKEYE